MESTNDTNDNLGLVGVVEHAGCHSTMAFLNCSQIFETNCVFPEEYLFSTFDHSLGINSNGSVLYAPGQDFPPNTNRPAGNQSQLRRPLHQNTSSSCQAKTTTRVDKQSRYGDFHIHRNWLQNFNVLEVAQDSNVVLRLVVRQFVPSFEELESDDTRGNKMFSIPWAIADPEDTTKEVNHYLVRCMGDYLVTNLDDSDQLVWGIFMWAVRLSTFPQPCRFHRDFARRRDFPVRFVEMPIINAIHSGAKTILAYFHYACKGQRPFSLEHNWSKDEAKNMAHLDEDQIAFVKKCRHLTQNNVYLQRVRDGHDYEEKYWFVGQIFEDNWVPKETKECSLPA
ncbi:hypothetical protein H9L39_16544 [Fusarium oxysporum f. sp. albedinis]|nr:hypothetical protein H9L39_16544 [Fusarium oxysporum f. sp. albedinis]